MLKTLLPGENSNLKIIKALEQYQDELHKLGKEYYFYGPIENYHIKIKDDKPEVYLTNIVDEEELDISLDVLIKKVDEFINNNAINEAISEKINEEKITCSVMIAVEGNRTLNSSLSIVIAYQFLPYLTKKYIELCHTDDDNTSYSKDDIKEKFIKGEYSFNFSKDQNKNPLKKLTVRAFYDNKLNLLGQHEIGNTDLTSQELSLIGINKKLITNHDIIASETINQIDFTKENKDESVEFQENINLSKKEKKSKVLDNISIAKNIEDFIFQVNLLNNNNVLIDFRGDYENRFYLDDNYNLRDKMSGIYLRQFIYDLTVEILYNFLYNDSRIQELNKKSDNISLSLEYNENIYPNVHIEYTYTKNLLEYKINSNEDFLYENDNIFYGTKKLENGVIKKIFYDKNEFLKSDVLSFKLKPLTFKDLERYDGELIYQVSDVYLTGAPKDEVEDFLNFNLNSLLNLKGEKLFNIGDNDYNLYNNSLERYLKTRYNGLLRYGHINVLEDDTFYYIEFNQVNFTFKNSESYLINNIFVQYHKKFFKIINFTVNQYIPMDITEILNHDKEPDFHLIPTGIQNSIRRDIENNITKYLENLLNIKHTDFKEGLLAILNTIKKNEVNNDN